MKDSAKSRAKLKAFLDPPPAGAVALRVRLFRKRSSSEGQRPYSAHIDWVAANGDTRRETLHPNPRPFGTFLWPLVFLAARRAGVGVERYVVADTLMRETRLVERWPARDLLRATARSTASGDRDRQYREGAGSADVASLRDAGFSVDRVVTDGEPEWTVAFERVQRPQPLWLLMTPLVILSCAWVVMLPKLRGFLNQVKVLTMTGQTVRHEYVVSAEQLRAVVHATGDLEPRAPLIVPLGDVVAFSAPDAPAAPSASVITRATTHSLPLPHEVKVSDAPITRGRAQALVAFLERQVSERDERRANASSPTQGF